MEENYKELTYRTISEVKDENNRKNSLSYWLIFGNKKWNFVSEDYAKKEVWKFKRKNKTNMGQIIRWKAKEADWINVFLLN